MIATGDAASVTFHRTMNTRNQAFVYLSGTGSFKSSMRVPMKDISDHGERKRGSSMELMEVRIDLCQSFSRDT